MPPILFITGTDTGVGKTTIACALVRALCNKGLYVGVLKPVETGCNPGADGRLFPADAVRLAEAASVSLDDPEVCPVRLATPASPDAAGQAEGRDISLAELDFALDRVGRTRDLIVVEGAGGLLVPLRRDLMMVDLAARWGASLLIVARSSLGTVNHTLLTVEAARSRNIPILGIVLNQVIPERGPDEVSNPDAIRERCDVPILGIFPHLAQTTTIEELGALAEKHLDLQGLCKALGLISSKPRT